MAQEQLRSELEAAYAAYVDALASGDLATFAEAVSFSPDMPLEAVEEDFAECTEFLLAATPPLSETTFVAVKTLGDDLAGYYCRWDDPDDPGSVNVSQTTFRKVDGVWKAVPGGGVSGFQPDPGEDLDARVAEMVESDPALALRPPDEETGFSGSFDPDLGAVLSCFAYGYELTVTVNGQPLPYEGGSSFSTRLFGAAAGEQPCMPGLLQVGDNRIEVAYRRSGEEGGFPLEVGVAIPAGHLFRLTTQQARGQVDQTFVIPRSPSDQLEPDEIRCVEIADEPS